MKILHVLGLLLLMVFLLIGEAIALNDFYYKRMLKHELSNVSKLQKIQMALVLVSFHSYYHAWPVPAGPLDNNAYLELGGFDEAKINTQHINFFEKNNCHGLLLTDLQGNDLYFVPDDSIGTCSVHSVYDNDKK